MFTAFVEVVLIVGFVGMQQREKTTRSKRCQCRRAKVFATFISGTVLVLRLGRTLKKMVALVREIRICLYLT